VAGKREKGVAESNSTELPRPACVVIVDDEPFVRETCGDVLEEAGYHVEKAENAGAALSVLERLGEAVDCVLLDVRLAPPNMPEQLDGVDVLRAIKSRWPDLGVIVISAYATVDNAVASLNLGADAYVRKPVNPEELLALITKTVERRHLAREKARLEAQAQKQNRFLREKNEELAAANTQLASANQQLETANHQLQEALRRLRETQAQLIQSEKLASLGQLVAGVAHELNNPISFVYSNMARLLEYVEDIRRVFAAHRRILDGLKVGTTPTREELSELDSLEAAADIGYILEDLQALSHESREGAERVQSVVLDLRNFSRLDEGEVQNVDLVQGIKSTLNLLRPELKHRVDLKLELKAVPNIRGNTAQLNQVVMNLVMNAAQAIEGEGSIRIATEPTSMGVRLIISDTGKGIPEDNLSKIFDPFFTTRKDRRGGGTGLGLAIVHSIIERHTGTIRAESTVGEGTTFTIDLPLTGYKSGPGTPGAPEQTLTAPVTTTEESTTRQEVTR